MKIVISQNAPVVKIKERYVYFNQRLNLCIANTVGSKIIDLARFNLISVSEVKRQLSLVYPQYSFEKLCEEIDDFVIDLLSEGILSKKTQFGKANRPKAFADSLGKVHYSSVIRPLVDELGSVPFLINFDLTEKCNFNCKHCYLPEREKSGLSLSEIDALFQQLSDYGVFVLGLSGGELFLRDDILDIISLAREKYDFYVSIKTNASLLTSKIIDELDKLGVQEILVSIYGFSDSAYSSAAGNKGGFRKVKKSLELLSHSNLEVHTRFVLMKQNYNDFLVARDYITKLGFSFNVIHQMTPTKSGDDYPFDVRLSDEEFETFLLQLKKNSVDIDSIFPVESRLSACIVGKAIGQIDRDGNVSLCPSFPLKLGNVFQKSFKEIWESSIILKRFLNFHESELQKCAKCDLKDKCLDRCIGTYHHMSKGKTFTEPSSEYCEHQHSVHKVLSKVRKLTQNHD